jgi:F0F1-type ATP synthase delta subunit
MISSRSISRAAVSLVKNDGKSPALVADKLFTFVKKYNLENQLPMILQYITEASVQEKKDNTLFIHTPFHVDEKLESGIKKVAQVKSEVHVHKEIDKDLLGGFVAYWQDKKIDGSVANSLRKLELSLLS